MSKIKFYHKPCGFFNSDPDLFCKFYVDSSCQIGIEDEESPDVLRSKEMEEFVIMERYKSKTDIEKEFIASKMHPCYLHITPDELLDAIQFYHNPKNSKRKK